MQNDTKILKPDTGGIETAACLLARGDLVSFPTETVYGLGADARNPDAVTAIYSAKGRPSFNPLIVHVASLELARDFADFNADAELLAAAFWPGPLTLVLPLVDGHGLAPQVTAGLDSVAIRVPDHPIARALLTAFGRPVAAPSANPSGKISPTTPAHVLDGLAGKISAVIDGGACDVGLESTIIGFDPSPTMLRPGGLPMGPIEQAIGQPVAALEQISSAPNAPGQLASHYAPTAALRLNATKAASDELMIGFGAITGELNLSPSGNLHEAAANLFAMLRLADATATGKIAVAPIPNTGLGLAINDRLNRAAAPR